jgi:hypothetical protein
VNHCGTVHILKQGGLAFVTPRMHSTIQRLAVSALQKSNTTAQAIAVCSSRVDSRINDLLQAHTTAYSYSFYASRNILLVHKLKERKNRP